MSWIPPRSLKCAVVLAAMLALSGCAEASWQGAISADPQVAYDAAKIAEGAYFASRHANPRVLSRLLQLDAAASVALRQYRAQPDPVRARRAQLAIADLANFLSAEVQF